MRFVSTGHSIATVKTSLRPAVRERMTQDDGLSLPRLRVTTFSLNLLLLHSLLLELHAKLSSSERPLLLLKYSNLRSTEKTSNEKSPPRPPDPEQTNATPLQILLLVIKEQIKQKVNTLQLDREVFRGGGGARLIPFRGRGFE